MRIRYSKQPLVNVNLPEIAIHSGEYPATADL